MRFEPASTESAFSLLEVLFVVAIILLVTVLYWAGPSGAKGKQNKQLCRENLEKLYIPLEIYANEHSGKFPEKAGAVNSEDVLDSLVPKYSVDTSLFICPGSKDEQLPSGESIAKRKISYSYYMGRKPGEYGDALMTDAQINTLSKAPGQQAFSTNNLPPGNNHKSGGNVLFADGHVDSTPPLAAFSLATTSGVVLLNP